MIKIKRMKKKTRLTRPLRPQRKRALPLLRAAAPQKENDVIKTVTKGIDLLLVIAKIVFFIGEHLPSFTSLLVMVVLAFILLVHHL
jgi:hypothetical protein